METIILFTNINSFDIHSSSKQICGYQDSLLEILELLVPRQSLLLSHPPVDGDGWEVLLNQELGQSHATLDRLHKNDNLEIKH